MNVGYADLIDQIQSLDIDTKEELFILLKKLIIEQRRTKIANNAAESFTELEQGLAKSGGIDDLLDDLYGKN